ncbi:Zinc ion binding protein, partial [Globisporangium splendens]
MATPDVTAVPLAAPTTPTTPTTPTAAATMKKSDEAPANETAAPSTPIDENDSVEQPQSPVMVAETAAPHNKPPPLELDKMVERTHQPSLGTNTDGSDDYSSDLGTPLGFGEADFGEGEDFSSHRFIGPSIAGDDASVRGVHGVRRVQIHAKPPRFVSELATTEKQRRASSSSSMRSGSNSGASSRSHSEAEEHVNTYSVSFTESSALGFKTDVVVTQSNELMVQVSSVEAGTPASCAGVVEGDVLLSVNGQKIESHMTEAEVLEIIRRASSPRTMLFQRTQTEPCEIVPHSKNDKKKKTNGKMYGRFSSAVSYGSSILGRETQAEAEARASELVLRRLRHGPDHWRIVDL